MCENSQLARKPLSQKLRKFLRGPPPLSDGPVNKTAQPHNSVSGYNKPVHNSIRLLKCGDTTNMAFVATQQKKNLVRSAILSSL